MKNNYWQIASGAEGRDYSEIFLRYGMAFVGGDKNSERIEAVQPGDRILLKRGISELLAVGVVEERNGIHFSHNDKEWLQDFDGWELGTYCYVRWYELGKEKRPDNGLTMGTIKRVNIHHLQNYAEQVISNNKIMDILPEPKPTKTVEDEEILQFLVHQGLRPRAAEDLTSALKRLRLLARYYFENEGIRWKDIREHETRSFLIIPLLLALGWSEQQIKIELPIKGRKRLDIACFNKPYLGNSTEDNNKNCVLILESKGYSQGLDFAPDQVKDYASNFKNCQTVVVSNGYCYKVYNREKGKPFNEKPTAYVNLLKPKSRYPLDPDDVDGCKEALKLLLPNSWS